MTLGTNRRRGRPGHDISTVLATSVEVFNERGFDGTSIEDLARRLEISKSAIYHHVESKDALLGLALDQALAGLEEVADTVRSRERWRLRCCTCVSARLRSRDRSVKRKTNRRCSFWDPSPSRSP